MLKINYMSTLFVGIDVSSKTNAVYAMDFEENKYISSSFGNNQPGADQLVTMIAQCMHKHKTWIRFLSCWNPLLYTACIFQTSYRPARSLMPYKPYVFCVKPKGRFELPKILYRNGKDRSHGCISHRGLRQGRPHEKLEPWRGGQFISLKRLTRHRMHLSGVHHQGEDLYGFESLSEVQ